MKSTLGRAALAAGIVAGSSIAAPLVAQPRGGEAPQRGGQPNPETPYILVTTFLSSDRQTGVQAGDELRRRIAMEKSAKELFVITKATINSALEGSGYRSDSALSQSDLMELARQLRGEYAVDGKVTKTGNGNAARFETRLLMRTGTTVVAQPLPTVEGKDAGDGAKQIAKHVDEALKQIPMYKECVASLRAAKYDEAAAKARAGISAYSNAAWSRVCLLNAYGLNKSTPPDSIITVANQVLAVDPASTLALSNLAEAYKSKGEKDKAIEVNLRIYRLDPANQAIAQSIVQELAQSGAPDKALPIIDSLIKDNPSDPGMVRTKWLLQLRVGHFKDAIATGDELARIDTASANLDFFNRQIGAAQSDSNNAKIIEIATKAEQKFPKEASFPALLAQTYLKGGQFAEARQAAGRATDIDAKNTDAWLFAIYAANQLNQPDTVLALGQKAIAAGADKARLAPTLLGPVGAALKQAQTSNARADWEETLKAAEMVDGIASSAESKFFIGVSSFQVAADILNTVQTLAKSPKAADKTQACVEVKTAEDYLAKTSMAMPAGGKFNPNVAAQILQNVGSSSEFIGQVKKAYCK